MRFLGWAVLTVLVAQLLSAYAQTLVCPDGIVCIHDNDGSEVCAEHASGGLNCPAGTHVDPSLGAVVPICDAGNVSCIQQNDGVGFCFPGYVCPAGSYQVGPVTLPTKCSNNQQLCVYGTSYGCFDLSCPPGMTPIGNIDCSIPPKTCNSGEKVCVYDNGDSVACQNSAFDCWPGTHEWKPCTPLFSLDFESHQIKLQNGHYIKCVGRLVLLDNGNVQCFMPILDAISWPFFYKRWDFLETEGRVLYLGDPDNNDNSLNWLLPIATGLGFRSVEGHYSSDELFSAYPPASWIFAWSNSPTDFPEYCYIDGNIVFWTDPRCQVDSVNSNYYPTSFTLIL